MSRSLGVAALGLSFAGLCASADASAQTDDRWFGSDKVMHFALSADVAAGGYTFATGLFHNVPPRLAFGAVASLGFGIGKELYDLTGHGTASWRDLAWDVVGTASGLAVVWLLQEWILAPARRYGCKQ